MYILHIYLLIFDKCMHLSNPNLYQYPEKFPSWPFLANPYLQEKSLFKFFVHSRIFYMKSLVCSFCVKPFQLTIMTVKSIHISYIRDLYE